MLELLKTCLTRCKKIQNTTNNYQRKQNKLTEQQRHQSASRRGRERQLARELVFKHGGTIGMEDLNYKAWQAKWGKRMLLTAPGMLRQMIKQECERVGGTFIELNATNLTLSQGCLCGSKTKKPLSQRTHDCSDCELTGLDRDLFSAFLGYYCIQNKVEVFEGSEAFPASPSIRTKAIELCATGGSPSTPSWGKLGVTLAGSNHSRAGRTLTLVSTCHDPKNNSQDLTNTQLE